MNEEKHMKPAVFYCDFNLFKDYQELAFGNDMKAQFEKVQEEYQELLEEITGSDYKATEDTIQEAFDLIQATINLLPFLKANVGHYAEHIHKKKMYLQNGKYPKK